MVVVVVVVVVVGLLLGSPPFRLISCPKKGERGCFGSQELLVVLV